MTLPAKEYIGDGVYISNDGYGITLTTEDGIRTTNTIYLEPGVVTEFERYLKTCRNWDTRSEASNAK